MSTAAGRNLNLLVATLAGAIAGAVVSLMIVWKFAPRPIDAPSIVYEPSPAEIALEKRIDEVDFKDATFDEIAKELTRKSGITVEVDWIQLTKEDVPRDYKFTFKARHASLEKILERFTGLDAQQDPWANVGYYVDHERICITTEADASWHASVRFYDISDFLGIAPAQESQLGSNTICWPSESSRIDAADKIIRMIVELVAPDTWRDNGGITGSIHVFANRLVIRQTDLNHRKIRKILYALRHPEPAARVTEKGGTP